MDLCLSKDLIAEDVHSQVGLCVDFVLKTSLTRQTLDNITCVMLFFDGFERIFNEHRTLYFGPQESKSSNEKSKNNLKESGQSKVSSSGKSTSNEDKEGGSQRKVKTANGMVKKTSSGLPPKNQAMSSSIMSSDIKDKVVNPQIQNMNSTFNYKGNGPSLKNNLGTPQLDSNKYPRELNEYVPNIPATTKNNKSKHLNFFPNKNV